MNLIAEVPAQIPEEEVAVAPLLDLVVIDAPQNQSIKHSLA